MLSSVAALGVSFHSVYVKTLPAPSHIYSSSSSAFLLLLKQTRLLFFFILFIFKTKQNGQISATTWNGQLETPVVF